MDKKQNDYSITDYKLSAALGSESFSLGIGYGWSSGDVNYYNRSNLFTLGAIYRPANFLSFSLVGNLPTNNEREGIVGVGLRPFGNYKLTFLVIIFLHRILYPKILPGVQAPQLSPSMG